MTEANFHFRDPRLS